MEKSLRTLLYNAVVKCRRLLEEDFALQLEGVYGIHVADGTVAPLASLKHLDAVGRADRRAIEAALRHFVASGTAANTAAAIERYVRESAFTFLNRLTALKLMEHPSRGLIQPSVGQGEHSRGFRQFALLSPEALRGEPGGGYRLYLELLFDDLAQALGVIFDCTAPTSILFPTQTCLREVLTLLNDPALESAWAEDETIGWVYQYFTPAELRDQARKASAAPRNSYELAFRNQFYTPRYVVQFLAENTLGRLWYEMAAGSRQRAEGGTQLAERCRYLIRPNEVATEPQSARREIESALCDLRASVAKRDPRTLRILDPAVGSGHFLLYCFDLLLIIYEEAWDWQVEVLRGQRAVGRGQHSGQKAEGRGQKGEGDGGEELSGSDRVAESDGFGGSGLSDDEGVPQGRDVWADQPAAESGSLDPVQHRRGTGTADDAGIRALPGDRARVAARGRDPGDDRASAGVSDSRAREGYAESLCGDRPFDPGAYEQALRQAGWDYNLTDSALRPLPSAYPSKQAFLRDVPRLILAHNLHGIDIDPRAAQIATLALWLRAQRAWAEMDIRARQRPRIEQIHIVCAEPMPGEYDLLGEFVRDLRPAVLGNLLRDVWEKMKLAGEAGSLLKIEQEIRDSVRRTRETLAAMPEAIQLTLFGEQPAQQLKLGLDPADLKDEAFWAEAEARVVEALRDYARRAAGEQSAPRRLFADDALQGIAFITMLQEPFDVVLMNPPFGAASLASKAYIERNYPRTKNDLYAAFIERGLELLRPDGYLGAITSRTGFFLTSFQRWREEILLKEARLIALADLGYGVLDTAMVETAAYVVQKRTISS